MNNAALLVEAHDQSLRPEGQSALTQRLTVIFGTCNAASRIAGGWTGDAMVVRDWPRALLLVIAASLATVGSTMIAIGGPGSLYVGDMFLGSAEGFCFAVWPPQARGENRYELC